MENKRDRYEVNLFKFGDYFFAKPLVLFVIDAMRFQVEYFANVNGGKDFYYCDEDTFFKVEKCDQLDSPVYVWGHDGGSYPLK